MTRPFVLGIDCKLYIMTENRVWSSDPESRKPRNWNEDVGEWSQIASWFTEVETVRDVTLSLTTATADVTSRASNGWRQMVSALKEGSVDTSVIWAPDDPNFALIMNTFINQCPISFLILDGPKNWFSGADPARCEAAGKVTGLYADFIVSEFSRGEPLEEAVTADITIQPALGMIYPQWVEIDTVIPPPA